MKTRQDYLAGKIEHRPYYAQFVNKAVINKVLRFISKKWLVESKDEHLNDIPLKMWDALTGFSFGIQGQIVARPTNIEPIEMSKLKKANEGVSCSTLVNIYKEAGKQFIYLNK